MVSLSNKGLFGNLRFPLPVFATHPEKIVLLINYIMKLESHPDSLLPVDAMG